MKPEKTIDELLWDRNVSRYEKLLSPVELKQEIPISIPAAKKVFEGREGIEKILRGDDKRIIAIIGPCSIHNVQEAYEYAANLKEIADKINSHFLVVMRTYFEKPRTNLGWQGMIEDPYLDGTYKKEEGLKLARKLLLAIAEIGIPTATEFLNTQTPQYISDVISYAAIGARTAEGQEHRKMASGLSMPTGLKNGSDGNLDVAINALKVALVPNSFRGIDNNGAACSVFTKGNRYAHIILRGGKKPNYDPKSVRDVQAKLKRESLPQQLVIDCSHGNTGKCYTKQSAVFKDVMKQIRMGNNCIAGVMLESYIKDGKQPISGKKYGVSKTDACISLKRTKDILLEEYEKMRTV